MSIIDNQAQRAAFQARIVKIIADVEDCRHQITVAVRGPRVSQVYHLLAECDFHLAESQAELQRAGARIAQLP